MIILEVKERGARERGEGGGWEGGFSKFHYD